MTDLSNNIEKKYIFLLIFVIYASQFLGLSFFGCDNFCEVKLIQNQIKILQAMSNIIMIYDIMFKQWIPKKGEYLN